MPTVEEILQSAEAKMQKAIAATQQEMSTLRTGRANPKLLDRVTVDYYGAPTPIAQMANLSVQGGQTIVIQPYDKGTMGDIEKAIAKSELNLPVNNDGVVLRINIPPLTEDSRKEMVKQVKKMGEEGKVAIRNVRRDAGADLDKLQKEANMSEDLFKGHQEAIQKLTDKYNGQMDKVVTEKEQELMQI